VAKTIKAEQKPTAPPIKESAQTPQAPTPDWAAEGHNMVTRADAGDATIAQPSSTPPTDAGPVNLIDDMTDPAYLAAHNFIFGADSSRILDCAQVEKEFKTFEDETRDGGVIDREIIRLQQSNQIHEVYRVLKDKLEVLLEVRAEARVKEGRLRYRHERSQTTADSSDLLGKQIITIGALRRLLLERAYKVTLWVLDRKLPEIKMIGIKSEDLRHDIGLFISNEKLGVDEIKGAKNILEIEVRNATQTTRIAPPPEPSKDKKEVDPPPPPELPVIYYKPIEKEHVKLTAETNWNLHVPIQKGLFKFLKQYFNSETGFPIAPCPAALRVCEAIEYPDINYATPDPLARSKAQRAVSSKFNRIKKAAKAVFTKDEDENPLSLLRNVGRANEIDGQHVRVIKFRLLPFPETQSPKPECPSRNSPTAA